LIEIVDCGTYSNAGALEQRLIRDKRQIIEASDLKIALEGAILEMRVLLGGCLDLKHVQTLDFEELDPDQ
jgi:hypothetical protein